MSNIKGNYDQQNIWKHVSWESPPPPLFKQQQSAKGLIACINPPHLQQQQQQQQQLTLDKFNNFPSFSFTFMPVFAYNDKTQDW